MLESASDIPFEDLDEDLAERYLESLEKLEGTCEFFSAASRVMTRIYGACALMAAGFYVTHPSETAVGVSGVVVGAGALGIKAFIEPLIHNRHLEAEFNRVEFEREWYKHLGIDD